MKTFSPSSNTIQQILRLKKYNQRIGPLTLSHEKDASLLQRIARDIAQGILSIRDLLFTTGLGLSHHKEIPLRLPALLLPILHVLKQCKEHSIEPPTYLVYQATEFIAETNGIPSIHAQNLALCMKHYLRRYIEVLHPDLVRHVRLELGCEYPDHVRSTVEKITKDIHMSSSDLLHQFMNCEQRHSQRSEKAAIYAGANVLYNGAVPEEYPFALDKKPYAILPVGGRAEKPFFMLTKKVAEARSATVIPLFTHLGSRPTYYPYPEKGDLFTIEEYRTHNIKDGPIRGDIEAMRADGATPAILDSILENCTLHP